MIARHRQPKTYLESLEPRQLLSGTPTPVRVRLFDRSGDVFPQTIVVAGNGDLYGTTQSTGSSGTLFKMDEGTGSYRTLYTFTGGADGGEPTETLLLNGQGDLFGTTMTGGANGFGTIFELQAGSTSVTTLYSYTAATRGHPLALDQSGNLFGAVAGSGGSDYGSIFEIQAGTGLVQTVYAFTQADGNADPFGLTVDAAGNVFGTAMMTPSVGMFAAVSPHSINHFGPTPSGVVFELPAGGGVLQKLYTFRTDEDVRSVAVDSQGNLFGTTSDESEAQQSYAYELPAGQTEVTTLDRFQYGGAMTMDSRGDFFVAAEHSDGTLTTGIYELPAGGSYQQVGSIVGEPFGALAVDERGDAFFTVSNSLQDGNGSVFEIVPAYHSKLSFTTEPVATAETGIGLGSPVAVSIDDEGQSFNYGNAPITVQILNAPAGATLGGVTTVTETNGVATFTGLIFPKAGTYTLVASSGSISPAVSTTIVVTDPPPVDPTLAASVLDVPGVKKKYALGQAIHIGSKVTSTGAGAAPGGTVVLEDENHQVLATGTVGKGGRVKLAAVTLAGGTHVCTLVYGGDATHAGTTTSEFSIVVDPAKTRTVLFPSSTVPQSGQTVVLRAQVLGQGDSRPTGNVTFWEGSTALGNAALAADGMASWSVAGAVVGKHVYRATYGGDADYLASHSGVRRALVRG